VRPPLRERVVVLFALGLAFATAACNRGPAEEALAAAEETLEGARADLERFAPEKLARLSRALGEARAALAEGRYTEALRVAQELPARVRRAVEAADRRRAAEIAAAWDDLSRHLPALIARLRARVAVLALTASPAAGPSDSARLETARTELRVISHAWEEATAAFEGGDIPRALTTARDVGARAETLADGLAPPSVPAPDLSTSNAPR